LGLEVIEILKLLNVYQQGILIPADFFDRKSKSIEFLKGDDLLRAEGN
jgi:hypothetical protein